MGTTILRTTTPRQLDGMGGPGATLPGMSAEETRELVDRAHAVRPYSNAARDTVPVRPRVV